VGSSSGASKLSIADIWQPESANTESQREDLADLLATHDQDRMFASPAAGGASGDGQKGSDGGASAEGGSSVGVYVVAAVVAVGAAGLVYALLTGFISF
jgi:hypothetical protein